jgi:hypothetical protein
VVGRPACRCRLDAFEAEIGQIERVDKGIHHTNGIALLDPLIEALRQQLRLSAIGTLNEALHELPPRQIAKRIIADSSFSRSQGQSRRFGDVRASSALALKADIHHKARHVSKVPILLQKSFCIDRYKFSGPYARRSTNHLRDYIVLR